MSPMLAVSLAAGSACAIALLLWIWSVCSVPVADDGPYRDRPPTFWRMAWPLVRVLAAHLAPFTSARARHARLAQLRRAGLDYSLDAEQFVAGQCLAAVLCAVVLAVAWSPRGMAPAWAMLAAGALGFMMPRSWLSDRLASRRRAVLKELPFYLDVITLAVESGLNLSSALAQAVDKGPPGPLRVEIGRVLRDIRAGRARAEALRGMVERLAIPAVGSLVSALLVAEKQGGALGPVLRAQAEQRRSERFLRAEKLAMEAPVKMLLPLLVFIFPCTFAILLFPVASRLLQEGWLR